ncbi:MAG: amidohydrolase family protein [Acutalibacteraceae bacterium]
MPKNRKVDFHSHFLPETYYKYLDEYEDKLPDNFPTPKWNIESHLRQMETLGIAFSFLSVSSPNLAKAPKETECEMVRQINLEGKALVDAHPDKLGLFASLPLPHENDAIEEAQYAHTVLHADGFALSTNYAGVYLGDKRYDKLMEYLDGIGAVVAVHPTAPSSMPEGVNTDVPIPAMEFMMDTTRTFMFMEMNNIFGRFPNIKWIFPHGGAFLAILSDRINGFAILMRNSRPDIPLDFKADMRHVYFDVAGFPLQKQLHALLKDVKVENLLYGSDAPYTPQIACVALSGSLETVSGLNADDKNKIFTENAVRLVPRLSDILGVHISGASVCYSDNPLTLREKTGRGVRTVISKLYGLIFS